MYRAPQEKGERKKREGRKIRFLYACSLEEEEAGGESLRRSSLLLQGVISSWTVAWGGTSSGFHE